MSIREGLGYDLRYYDPCFNYNADLFCCSKRGANFRNNILMSEAPLTPSTDYNRPRNKADLPFDAAKTGYVQPQSYEFTPQQRWYIWCDRMPCSVNQHGVPCQNNMPICSNSPNCGKQQ